MQELYEYFFLYKQLPLVFKLVFSLVSILIAFVIHEMCHGYAAFLFGDPTAKYQGRLSFNPIVHIDPIGGLVLLLTALFSPVVFGWAKPVSVNPYNFRNPRQDMAWVAFAGPLSNFALAAIAGLLLKFHIVTPDSPFNLAMLVFTFVMVNIGLGIFNLVPFPPLDGSKIIYGILPSDLAYKLMEFEQRYATIIPFVLMFIIWTRVLNQFMSVPFIILIRLFTT
ncbi:MAG: site-2 protease family protein [Firmicutes bacterium]|nr:site-2 protease family protein [Bacillota bacterium]